MAHRRLSVQRPSAATGIGAWLGSFQQVDQESSAALEPSAESMESTRAMNRASISEGSTSRCSRYVASICDLPAKRRATTPGPRPDAMCAAPAKPSANPAETKVIITS
mmetsp:Transcript_1307/g.2335  ORF Transcript_1307/g.2335 Transcript_1307/m.2335 type:complete len:108 (+) Transcript_1307:403-726(+)